MRKLESIIVPKINFTGMALTRVIESLSELSVDYDPEGKGVNIVPIFDSNKTNPDVNITLRNLSLDKIIVCNSASKFFIRRTRCCDYSA